MIEPALHTKIAKHVFQSKETPYMCDLDNYITSEHRILLARE